MSDDASAVLERLTALHPKLIDLSLDRMVRLLADLGDPQLRLPPVVHIAGTNGKGSLTAYLKAIFEAAGYRPHAYTSPHLVRFNERIAPAGRIIEDAPLVALLERVEQVNGDRPITFFEATTAAAFLAFAETPGDVTLLEVGLGGRLDATNVVAAPALTAIAPISIDHQSFLGDSLVEIAGEKAGILKPGVVGVVGRQVPEAAAVLEAANVPLIRMDREWQVEPTPGGFRYRDAAGMLDLPRPALFGRHQIDNAATAVACAMQLRRLFDLPDAAIAEGIASAVWPARMQRLTKGPLAAGLPPGTELWLDGGHNGGAAEALAPTLAEWHDRPLRMVLGMRDTKHPRAFLEPLKPYIEALRTVASPEDPNALSAESQAATARDLGIPVKAASSIAEAVAELAEPPGARILVCGSLYLAGSVLKENG